MTVYTTLPTDDQNLAITVTDDPNLVTINITPVVFSGGGGSGTVTNVASGTGLSGGPITTTGTLTIDSTVATLTGAQALSNKTGNISQWTNDSGYLTSETDSQTLSFSTPDLTITSGNTVDISALTSGLITASSTDTLTNKSGSNTQWTNDENYSTTTNNADNRVVTGTGTTNTINGEANFTFDGSNALISGSAAALTTPVLQLTTDNSGWDRPQMMFTDDSDDIFTQVGRNNTGSSYYQCGITLDPNNTKGRTGVTTYAGDCFIGFEKVYSDQSDIRMDMNVYGAHQAFRLNVRDDYNSGGGNQYQPRPFLVHALDTTIHVGTALSEAFKAETTGITFYNEYTFPLLDGDADQVLTTDGAGTLTWVTGGGGGATDLDSLTDVDITSVANNDLLMYNSVASKWQNTNLGVSVTPTLTGDSSVTTTSTYTLTVSNHATYDDPAYFCEVYTGVTKVVDNDDVTQNHDGTMSFIAPAVGTHEIRIRCQDFGDLQSEIATKALTTVAIGGTYRYWRMHAWTGAAATSVMVSNFALYTATSQGGTKYPENMTSNTLPTPSVAGGVGAYSVSYDYWKAFDANVSTTMYWNLAGNNATDYIDVDLGSAVAISSFNVYPSNNPTYTWTGCQLQASTTGAWGGEEVTIYTATGVPGTGLNIG